MSAPNFAPHGLRISRSPPFNGPSQESATHPASGLFSRIQLVATSVAAPSAEADTSDMIGPLDGRRRGHDHQSIDSRPTEALDSWHSATTRELQLQTRGVRAFRQLVAARRRARGAPSHRYPALDVGPDEALIEYRDSEDDEQVIFNHTRASRSIFSTVEDFDDDAPRQSPPRPTTSAGGLPAYLGSTALPTACYLDLDMVRIESLASARLSRGFSCRDGLMGKKGQPAIDCGS